MVNLPQDAYLLFDHDNLIITDLIPMKTFDRIPRLWIRDFRGKSDHPELAMTDNPSNLVDFPDILFYNNAVDAFLSLRNLIVIQMLVFSYGVQI